MIVLQNIVWLLVLIGVMILIHELGHFWAARFSTSKWKHSASASVRGCSASGAARPTTASRLILFGGYVKMAGEQAGDENVRSIRAAFWRSRAGSA